MNIFNIQSRRGSTNKHIHHLLDHHRCSSSKRFFIQFQGEDDPQLGIVECHHSKYLISSSPLVWYKTNSHQSLIICKNHPEWMKSWGTKLYYLSPGLIKQRSIFIFFQSTFIFWTGNQAGGTVVPVNTDWEQCQTQCPNDQCYTQCPNDLMTKWPNVPNDQF